MNKTIYGSFKVTSPQYGQFLRDAHAAGVDLSKYYTDIDGRHVNIESDVDEETASMLILKYGPEVYVYEDEDDDTEDHFDELMAMYKALDDIKEDINTLKKTNEKTNKFVKYFSSGW